jgi:hypothetical protein
MKAYDIAKEPYAELSVGENKTMRFTAYLLKEGERWAWK